VAGGFLRGDDLGGQQIAFAGNHVKDAGHFKNAGRWHTRR
jgi:hypothetical protein